MLTKYIKTLLCGVAVRLSYIQDARCLKDNVDPGVDGRKTLSRILREKNVRLCAGFIMCKRHTGSELTVTQQ